MKDVEEPCYVVETYRQGRHECMTSGWRRSLAQAIVDLDVFQWSERERDQAMWDRVPGNKGKRPT